MPEYKVNYTPTITSKFQPQGDGMLGCVYNIKASNIF